MFWYYLFGLYIPIVVSYVLLSRKTMDVTAHQFLIMLLTGSFPMLRELVLLWLFYITVIDTDMILFKKEKS